MAAGSALAARRPRAASAYQVIQVQDLSAGLDLRRSPSLLAPGRSTILRNWSLQEPGALVTRTGWSTFSTTSLGSGRAQGGARVYLATGTFTLVGWGGKVYQPSDAGVWGSAVLSGLNGTNGIHFPYDQTIVAAFDGATAPSKSKDGTTWTSDGIAAPAAAPTLALASGGSLTQPDEYEISYGYQDDSLGYPGNEGPTATITTTSSDQTIQVTCARSTDPQVTTIIVYGRDVTAGETTRVQIGTVANPASGSAVFTLSTKTWTTSSTPAPTTNNLPPTMKFAAVWKNRWWGADATIGNRLWFSQIFLPQAWPVLFYLDLPFAQGDSIAALVALGDVLLVFGQSTIFLVIGQTSLDFEVRPALGVQEGAFGPWAVAPLENGVLHGGAGGLYLFDGTIDQYLGDSIDPGWQDLVKNSAPTDLARIAVVYHRVTKEVRISVPRLYPWGVAGEWVLDLHRTRLQNDPAWTQTDRAIGGFLSWDGNESLTGNRGRLFSWDATTGQLREENLGHTADGADLSCDWAGAVHLTGLNVARFIDSRLDVQPAAGTLTLTPFVDGVNQGAVPLGIGASLPIYGQCTYGQVLYGGTATRLTVPQPMPLGAEGKGVQLQANYTGSALFKLYSYAIGLVPEPVPRGM